MNQSLEKQILINQPAAQVWRMFSDPSFTQQMGGEYVSDWQVGSMLRWKTADGKILTNGRILQIRQNKLLQHTLLYPGELSDVLATITYSLEESEGSTTLSIREDFTEPVTENEYLDAVEGWDAALKLVKELLGD